MNIPRPEHPKPQFERSEWLNLNGQWTFRFDHGKSGVDRKWFTEKGFENTITVPFCPESRLSGVAYTDFIESMWYHRKLEVPGSWKGKLVLLHFGAVDYEAGVFIDGQSAGGHWGGSSSFSIDITKFVRAGGVYDLVVHVRDELRSGRQTGGKQSPLAESYGCLYTRTTGIWQTVWVEAVSPAGLRSCRTIADYDGDAFVFVPEFYSIGKGNIFEIVIAGEKTFSATPANGVPLVCKLSRRNEWAPENPYLYDIVFRVKDSAGHILDEVKSYAGLRKIHLEGNRVFLNNRPLYFRFVLDQGFYPDGIWTAPSDEALKNDITLSMKAGFNGTRLHQKVFEERFHYWADKLGYLTWAESPSWGMSLWKHAGGKTDIDGSCRNFLSEWREIVMRDLNHPSIIAWTPLNETSNTVEMREHKRFVRELYEMTHQLDPSRPVNDTSGYVHVVTDLYTVHNYHQPDELRKELAAGPVNVWRNFPEEDAPYEGQPYIIDEMGGIKYGSGSSSESWGYNFTDSEEEFYKRLGDEVNAILEHDYVSGYCYTQLTDVEQEQNGIYNYDRSPKFDMEKISAIFSESGLF